MKVLVTGGAGYIGRTVVSALADRGHTPIILDSLVTGRREFTEGHLFYEGDIADIALLTTIMKEHPDITHCLHFAALVIVPESVMHPYAYYQANVSKSLTLFKTLHELGCHNIVFSSSASLYDVVEGFQVTETSPLNPSSPYARTKYMMEMVLRDFCQAYGMRGIALRYFNPIGADPLLRSGSHVQAPSHVLAKLLETVSTPGQTFTLTGTDWPTRDGSGIRDYIHVWDLAQAHVKAVEHFETAFESVASTPDSSYLVINLGTGTGVTVRELVQQFEAVTQQSVPVICANPRPGDVAGAYANCDRAKALIDWEATYSIQEAISHALAWEAIRPNRLRYDPS